MLGLFECVERAFENVALSIEGAFVKARCDVANHIVDVKLRRKLRKYEKMRREYGEEVEDELDSEEEIKESEELETPETHDGTSVGVMARTFINAMVQNPNEKWNNQGTEGDL